MDRPVVSTRTLSTCENVRADGRTPAGRRPSTAIRRRPAVGRRSELCRSRRRCSEQVTQRPRTCVARDLCEFRTRARPVADRRFRSRSVPARPRFTHIWGQLCGWTAQRTWTDRPAPVDNRCSSRGQIAFDDLCPPDRETAHHRSMGSLHNPPHRWNCGNRLHPHYAQALVLLLVFSSRGTTQEQATWMDRSGGPNWVATGRGDTRCPEALRWSSGSGRSGRTQRGARRRNRHDPWPSRRSVHRARPPHRQRERSPP
jgi:hypothetical protein